MEDMNFDRALRACRYPAYGVHDGAKLLECSEELARMFGSTPAEVAGREVLSFITPQGRDESIAAIMNYSSGPYRSEGVNGDGNKFPIEVSGFPVRWRRGAARLLLVRDLSPVALVVDDEPQVANMTASLLRMKGYQTAIYTSPAKALAQYEPRYASVIFSDVRMPEMDGIRLVEHVRQIDPTVPVVFMSGYTERPVPCNAETLFVKKPFGIPELGKALNDLPVRARAPID